MHYAHAAKRSEEHIHLFLPATSGDTDSNNEHAILGAKTFPSETFQSTVTVEHDVSACEYLVSDVQSARETKRFLGIRKEQLAGLQPAHITAVQDWTVVLADGLGVPRELEHSLVQPKG
jgi:hypothetical protein